MAAIAVLVLLLSTGGAAHAKTYVFTSDEGIKYKPGELKWPYGFPRTVDSRIMKLSWRGWGSSRAIGTGYSFACGKAGCRYVTRVRVVLRNRRSCGGDTYYLKGRARIRGKHYDALFGNGCN